ncbi:MAG: AsmA family protein [Gammaproteobacteria bacterium]|nr:AsmA family protein [Gammaproteobacteria bacterium]
MAVFLSILRWSLLALLLVLLALTAVLSFAGEDFYKKRITEAVEAATGRPLRIDGGVSLASVLPPRISFSKVRYPNAEWSAPPWAFEAETVSIELTLDALVRGELNIGDVVVVRPKLWVEKNADGVYNLAPAPGHSRPGSGVELMVVELLNQSDPRIVNGEITVITRRRQWDLRIDDARAELDSSGERIAVKFEGALEGTPIDAAGSIGSLEEIFAMQPVELQLEGTVGHRDNRARTTGRVGNLLKWRDVDLPLEFEFAHPDALSRIAGLRVRDIGAVSGSARFLQGVGVATNRLEEIELRSENLGLQSALSGRIGKLHGRDDYDMTITVGGPLGRAVPALAAAGLRADLRGRLHGALDDLALRIEEARAGSDALSLRASGELRLRERVWTGELPLLAEFNGFAGLPGAAALAPLAPLRANGTLVRAPKSWQLRDIEMSSERSGFSLRAQGLIGDLLRRRGFDLMVQAQMDDLTRRPWGAKLPPDARLQLRAHLRDGDESNNAGGGIDLRDIDASLSAPQFAFAARGDLRGIGEAMRSDISLSMRFDAPEPLRALLPAAPAVLLEPLVPLRASAQLRSRNAREWSASLASQPSAAEGGESQDALELSFDWAMQPGKTAVENLSLSLDAGGFRLRARGGIEQLRPPRFARLNVEFDAERAGALRPLGLGALHPEKALSLEAQFSLQSAESEGGADFRAGIARLTLGESDVRGEVEARMSDGESPALVRADLQSENFDLEEIFPPVKKDRERFFSPAPLSTEWIPKVDADIALRAARAGHRWLDMRGATARVRVQNGVWYQTIRGAVGEGDAPLHLDMRFDAGSRPQELHFTARGEQLDTAGLRAFRDDRYLDGGVFRADADVRARGDSLAALAAAANGGLSLRFDDMRMKNQAIDVFGGDIFANILTAANPFRSIGEYVDVECAIMKFELADGVASAGENLAIKTERMTMRANGSINFADESLQFLISPKARTGLGINSSSLVKLVRVGGTLAQPQIETDAVRLLQTGAVVWAAIFSGGWSLIAQGLFDRASADADVCGGEIAEQNGAAEPGLPRAE